MGIEQWRMIADRRADREIVVPGQVQHQVGDR
jgi:hypothetical protein